MKTKVLLLACLLWLAGAALAGRYEVRLDGRKGRLGALDGRAVAVWPPDQFYDWELVRPGGRMDLKVLAPERDRGRFLAYDPEAEGDRKGAVFFADKRSPGTSWEVTMADREARTYTIAAASGKVKGWSLEVEKNGKEFEGKNGKKSTAYRVFLSEKPKQPQKWDFYEFNP